MVRGFSVALKFPCLRRNPSRRRDYYTCVQETTDDMSSELAELGSGHWLVVTVVVDVESFASRVHAHVISEDSLENVG